MVIVTVLIIQSIQVATTRSVHVIGKTIGLAVGNADSGARVAQRPHALSQLSFYPNADHLTAQVVHLETPVSAKKTLKRYYR